MFNLQIGYRPSRSRPSSQRFSQFWKDFQLLCQSRRHRLRNSTVTLRICRYLQKRAKIDMSHADKLCMVKRAAFLMISGMIYRDSLQNSMVIRSIIHLLQARWHCSFQWASRSAIHSFLLSSPSSSSQCRPHRCPASASSNSTETVRPTVRLNSLGMLARHHCTGHHRDRHR